MNVISAIHILSLEPNATLDDLRRQYRSIALSCHPDKHPNGIEEATERFKILGQAYDLLNKWFEEGKPPPTTPKSPRSPKGTVRPVAQIQTELLTNIKPILRELIRVRDFARTTLSKSPSLDAFLNSANMAVRRTMKLERRLRDMDPDDCNMGCMAQLVQFEYSVQLAADLLPKLVGRCSLVTTSEPKTRQVAAQALSVFMHQVFNH